MPDSDPRVDLVRELRSKNIPEEQIFDLLDRYDAEGGVSPYEQHIASEAAVTPRTRLEVAQQKEREKQQGIAFGKGAIGAGIVGGTALLGGLPAAALAPEGWGVLAGIAGQTAGSYGGELLRQKVFGEPTSQREARKAALMTAIPGIAGHGASKILGAGGGIPAAATEYVGVRSKVVPRYDLTMLEPGTRAELDLGRRIGAEVKSQSIPLTPGRIAEAGYIDQATQAGQRIDPQPVIDTLKQKMLKTPKTAVGRNYNKKLGELSDALEQRKASGGVTPFELDELIGGELDPSIYRGGKASGKMTAKGMVPARESARKSLMGALPPEASIARRQAAEELSRRELAEKYFGLGSNEKTVVNNVRHLFEPGNEGALESLQGISKQADIDFVTMAREISVKRSFNADDRIKVGMLHRIMMSIGAVGIATGRPGYAAAALLSQPAAMRTGAKLIAPLQMLLGPAGATMAQVYKNRYPLTREKPKVSPTSEKHPVPWKETAATPEQLFPNMTNIGDNK